ncbi:hypothetical protein AKJ36_00880 [candidate division MSBL1 archaeon SCGC-AAA259I07]|uniref:Uncharacterized protein n=1 Tax=candidate division MSBL1 archaeon SCGC-AAA259I07 TaxID=1698266 RepID=A0A133UM68_9EURY|nr:hypothetical protein AKJ36_00880 [candidate division MSBL1 archaeon SCGC-AAA259I07]
MPIKFWICTQIIKRFDFEEICNAFERDKTIEEIADKIGLDRTTVTKIVNKFSVKEIHNTFSNC